MTELLPHLGTTGAIVAAVILLLREIRRMGGGDKLEGLEAAVGRLKADHEAQRVQLDQMGSSVLMTGETVDGMDRKLERVLTRVDSNADAVRQLTGSVAVNHTAIQLLARENRNGT